MMTTTIRFDRSGDDLVFPHEGHAIRIPLWPQGVETSIGNLLRGLFMYTADFGIIVNRDCTEEYSAPSYTTVLRGELSHERVRDIILDRLPEYSKRVAVARDAWEIQSRIYADILSPEEKK